MHQQKLLHGHTGVDKKDHHRGGSGLGGTTSTSSSLHRFSVDALAGTGSSSKKRTAADLTSDDDNSINSWDEVGDCSEDDDIDVDDVGPLSPTTSESSRGGSSPTSRRRRK